MRAKGHCSRDVMSQAGLSVGGVWRWDSVPRNGSGAESVVWRDDSQAPDHTENKPCPDTRLCKHNLLRVQKGTQSWASR